jgi:PIF1-like helicase
LLPKKVSGCAIIDSFEPSYFQGDFRQTLPVVKRGTRYDAVQKSIKMFELWHLFREKKLTTNMRANAEEREFAQWLRDLGRYIYLKIRFFIFMNLFLYILPCITQSWTPRKLY